jgi:hypothetical protein
MAEAAAKRLDSMPTFQVAQVRHGDQDMVIVPLDRAFGKRSSTEQARIQEAFQRSASAAKLPGVVVLVWEDSHGKMAHRAPPTLNDFLKSIDMVYVATALNRTLSLETR